MNIEYRAENKYLISDPDIHVIARRLSPLMEPDLHHTGECYEVRSIYFDDLWDTCMNENDAGVDARKKFRIRTYASPGAPLKLEIKEKLRGFTKKTGCPLTHEEYHALLSGGALMEFGEKPALNQLLLQMRCRRMQPRTLVAYERTAFIHPAGNVRITFDRNIMAGTDFDSFFDPQLSGLIPVLPTGMHVMEVKYDEFLPDIISQQLEIGKLQQTAFSKYYLGRSAINGVFP